MSDVHTTESLDAEDIERIQAWATEDPSRIPYLKDVWWIALRAGANWALRGAQHQAPPASPFV